ncbi:DUF1043 family protein [Vibrio sp. SM6]|uniref:Z-ring associated protein G n=1 Tax=Vibrio agarilyticus TaxID=2726741 RepID=A0A7X8TP54_9VIBR|nr:Z-ring associated protein ZapG [Vibrio agarilyticus]NLS12318.1 DUF1043 family protein [Vibrio agarilyticus]
MIWMYTLGGLVVGVIIGVVATKLSSPDHKKQKATYKELETAKFALEQQRQELVDHFAQAAEMLDVLGKDYSKLYQHMAKTSAELLPNLPAQDNPFDKKLAKADNRDDENAVSEPPKDYANGATGLFSMQQAIPVSSPDTQTVRESA